MSLTRPDIAPASPNGAASAAPLLSVIVPVHRAEQHLRRVLVALAQSRLPRERWELIVVDDASDDASAAIAAGHADLVIRLKGKPRGPAYARNRGFEVARSAMIAFVDADVLVDPDALPRMLEAIEDHPDAGAVIGTYDASPTTGTLVSEYRNLLRHVEQQRGDGDTDTFSAGLALVRRDAFARAGMFDEWRFPRPQLESLELGDRLRALGYGIRRRLDATGTHLRRWTIGQWIMVDLFDRGMSVSRIGQSAAFRTRASRLYLATLPDAALAWIAILGLALGAWQGRLEIIAVAVGALIVLVARTAVLFTAFRRKRGVLFALCTVPLHLVTCAMYGLATLVGRALFHAVGEPEPDPVTQAFAEVGVRTWPPVRAPRSTAGILPIRLNGSNGERGLHNPSTEP